MSRRQGGGGPAVVVLLLIALALAILGLSGALPTVVSRVLAWLRNPTRAGAAATTAAKGRTIKKASSFPPKTGRGTTVPVYGTQNKAGVEARRVRSIREGLTRPVQQPGVTTPAGQHYGPVIDTILRDLGPTISSNAQDLPELLHGLEVIPLGG